MPLDPRSLPSFFNDSLLKHLFNCNKEAMNNYCWISALFIASWLQLKKVLQQWYSPPPLLLLAPCLQWYGEISSFFPFPLPLLPPHKTLLYLSHSTYNMTITSLLIPHNHMHSFNSLIVPLPTKRCCNCLQHDKLIDNPQPYASLYCMWPIDITAPTRCLVSIPPGLDDYWGSGWGCYDAQSPSLTSGMRVHFQLATVTYA